jgi:hypothetical protein
VTELTWQDSLFISAPESDVAPKRDADRVAKLARRLPSWVIPAALIAAAACGLTLFLLSLRGIDLAGMNGLGLLSVLPIGALAGVALIAVALILGLAQAKAYPAALGTLLVSLVICLDGVTAFAEPEPRFPTTYQIAGFVQYVSSTGHAAPGLAAYFSWPGFFALISFLTGGAGTHSLLTLLKVWPMIIDLLCLAPLFLLMRNLRISWRAQWLAGFFFTVGNWVGQDYFSPQSFDFLLYLVFVAILVNWFVDPDRDEPLPLLRSWWEARTSRRTWSNLRSGELPPQPASTGQRAFLLTLLIALFVVATVSHQLTPFFMIGALVGLVVVQRCTLPGLPLVLGVILAGYISFAAAGYWSGHLSNIFSGIGHLGLNVTSGVSGRLVGSTPTHRLALDAREAVAALIIGLAALGLVRRRAKGTSDRVLLALLVMPLVLIGVVSYGGEITLRTYLFMLPAASVLAGMLFFPDWHSARPNWRLVTVLAGCAVVLPVSFFLARYGNDAFEQVPPGELAASNWIYAHDSHGVRLLWLSTDPVNDVTPQMPWAYQDLTKVVYVPALAPRDPANTFGIVRALFVAGPGSYLIADRTQIAAIQQTASYPADWGVRFHRSMYSYRHVRVVFVNDSVVVYALDWPPSARALPLDVSTTAVAPHRYTWTRAGLIVFWLLLVLLAARQFIRLWRPSARTIRVLWLASLPLLVLLVGDIVIRFVEVS